MTGPFLIPGVIIHDCASEGSHIGHALPLATGFVRHRQSRQAEGGTIRKGARQPGHESRDPVAAPSFGGQRPEDCRPDRSAAGRPSSRDRPNIRAVHSPRPLRPAARSRWKRERSFSKLVERIVRCVGVNAWRVGAPFAAKLASHRHRRSGCHPGGPGGRLVRGDCRRSRRRHAHVTLARLPAGAPGCAASASAWVALPESQTDRRDREISEALRPGKTR